MMPAPLRVVAVQVVPPPNDDDGTYEAFAPGDFAPPSAPHYVSADDSQQTAERTLYV